MRKNNSPVSIGDVGEGEVDVGLRRFGWNVWSTNNRDRGTDLIVLANDVDRPVAFGVQVKSGPSYFTSKEHDGNGQDSGWWYAESTPRHFDYWIRHTLPHILVLYDDDEHAAYWVHVTADKVASTGKGRKILVPADQTIDEDHRRDLLTAAYGQGHPPMLEGTAYWASAENIPPEQRLRYALIAPRLVAPHRNAGYGNLISAVEAVALLAQGRFRDLAAFAEQHPEVPDPKEEPPVGSDWAWSFAAAILELGRNRLRRPLASCLRPRTRWTREGSERGAAGVCASATPHAWRGHGAAQWAR